MGKSKRQENSGFSFVVDLKSVLALKPEQRVKWLSKACRAVEDGEASIKHVFDVLTSKKVVHGVHPKVGMRMMRTLRDNLYLFSDKQQRYLLEESPLAQEFGEKSEEEAPAKATKATKAKVAEVNEEASPVAAKSSGSGSGSGTGTDAAARMEEMMARCRDFVREKASSFDDRAREAEETRQRAEEARKKAVAEQRAREWQAIADWHKNLEAWEAACMAAVDDRLGRLAELKKQEEMERAEAAAVAAGDAPPASSEKPVAKSKKRKAKSSDASDDVTAAVLRGGEKDRDRDRDRGDRERDRDRDRARRRSRSGSRGRKRRRGEKEDGAEEEVAAVLQPPSSKSGSGGGSSGVGGVTSPEAQASRRRFAETDASQAAQAYKVPPNVTTDGQAMKKALDVQKILGNVGGNIAAQVQAFDAVPSSAPPSSASHGHPQQLPPGAGHAPLGSFGGGGGACGGLPGFGAPPIGMRPPPMPGLGGLPTGGLHTGAVGTTGGLPGVGGLPGLSTGGLPTGGLGLSTLPGGAFGGGGGFGGSTGAGTAGFGAGQGTGAFGRPGLGPGGGMSSGMPAGMGTMPAFGGQLPPPPSVPGMGCGGGGGLPGGLSNGTLAGMLRGQPPGR